MNISASNFENEVLNSNQPVLMYYWAKWCSDCKSFAPIFDQLVEEYKGKIKLVKLDIDDNIEIANKFFVMSIPTLLLFKNGAPIARMVEERNRDTIKQIIDKELS